MTEEKRRPGFQPGVSGNPRGKPMGAKNHATRLVLSLMEDGAREVAERVIAAARSGDLQAAKIVLERICPPLRERPIDLLLPSTDTAAGISAAQQMVVEAVADGALTPGEGKILSDLVEARRKAMETQELEARIAALEERQK